MNAADTGCCLFTESTRRIASALALRSGWMFGLKVSVPKLESLDTSLNSNVSFEK